MARRVTAGAITTLLFVACSSPAESPASVEPTATSGQAAAEQALCDSLVAFGESLDALGAFNPAEDSVEDLYAMRDDVAEAWDAVHAAAAGVTDADDEAIATAWADLADRLSDLPTDVPLADVKFVVDEGVANVRAAYQEMRNGLTCE
jgi:hypothetical protein